MKRTESGIYAPSYYNDFKCIADRCQHSCCINWEIYIDEATFAKYKKHKDILASIKDGGDGPCFVLRENGRCPHLNDKGLCEIVISHGEEYLSEICRNHPRFYNYINDDIIEAGLGIVCEEACRLILENERPFSLMKVEDLDSREVSVEFDEAAALDSCSFDVSLAEEDDFAFNPLPLRDHIVSKLESSEVCFEEKSLALKEEFAIPSLYSLDEWLDVFLSLEILEADWKSDLQAMRGNLLQPNPEMADRYGKYYERLSVYFVYRHVSAAGSLDDFRARLAFALFSVEMIRALFETDMAQAGLLGDSPRMSFVNSAGAIEKLIDWARRYSAEIEYSEENTDALVFAFENSISEWQLILSEDKKKDNE